MYNAVGVIELKCLPKGVEAADAALKSAGIPLPGFGGEDLTVFQSSELSSEFLKHLV